ncbi:hypothetical protein BHM03_00055094, partial [Ensete ventricosum]
RGLFLPLSTVFPCLQQGKTKTVEVGVGRLENMTTVGSGREEEPLAEVSCNKVDGCQLDQLCVRADPGDPSEEARGL